MQIDRKLNLVIPVERDKVTIYVHSTPISKEVFDNYFLVMAKAFSMMYSAGAIVAPRIAHLSLRKVAIEMGQWEGAEGVENGLLNEIRRLSNAIIPGPNGWQTIPYYEVIQKKLFTDEEIAEVEGAISFFILVSALHKKNQIASILDLMNGLWSTQTTLLNVTEYAASLPILTGTGNSGEKAASSAISLPS